MELKTGYKMNQRPYAMDYMHKLDEIWKYTSTWNSDRHPGSTMSASPLTTKLFSSELFGTFSGANTTKFVV